MGAACLDDAVAESRSGRPQHAAHGMKRLRQRARAFAWLHALYGRGAGRHSARGGNSAGIVATWWRRPWAVVMESECGRNFCCWQMPQSSTCSFMRVVSVGVTGGVVTGSSVVTAVVCCLGCSRAGMRWGAGSGDIPYTCGRFSLHFSGAVYLQAGSTACLEDCLTARAVSPVGPSQVAYRSSSHSGFAVPSVAQPSQLLLRSTAMQ